MILPSFLEEAPQKEIWRADFGKHSYPLLASKPVFSGSHLQALE